MKLVTVEQMLELERQANANGLSYSDMMANAGVGLADLIIKEFSNIEIKNVLGLVGSGNNGGDTLVVLKHLAQNGWSASAYLAKKRPENDLLVKAFIEAGGGLFAIENDTDLSALEDLVGKAQVLLDGILGTGIKLPLRGDIQKILKSVGKIKTKPCIIAVDCPSGVDCETGEAADECLKADITVCMAAVKKGLLTFPAFGLAGEIRTLDIGLPASLKAWDQVKGKVVGTREAAELLPKRSADSHKGSHGALMIVAGSVNYCGAVLLSAESACRMGVGLVKVAIPGAIYEAIAGQLPECTWIMLPHSQGVINSNSAVVITQNIRSCSALLLGPGWGLENETLEFLKKLLPNNETGLHRQKTLGFKQSEEGTDHGKIELPPMVVDADGLKLLSKIPNWEKKIPERSVLTPHPGEMSVLTGINVDEIQKNRIEIAMEFSKKWEHIVVLKGAGTVVADPEEKYSIIPVATSALAKAGTGDVLAGMIAGSLAQEMDAYDAAVLAAWIHAQAGISAADRLGTEMSVNASDVIHAIAGVIKQISGIE